jgi:hypothetical protein
MSDKPPNSGDGGGRKGQPRERGRRSDEPPGSSRRGEHRERSPMNVEEETHAWSWSQGLYIIYHPRGCKICMDYGLHVMEAEFTKDGEYAAASRLRQEESEFWQKKATRYMDELDEAEAHIRHLEARIRELEEEVDHSREYEDKRGGKHARYDSPHSYRSGTDSPAMPTPPSRLEEPRGGNPRDYARVLQQPTLKHVQEDVHMEDDKEERFPPLPKPNPPLAPAIGSSSMPRGSNWTPAPPSHPMVSMRGGLTGRVMPRHPPLVLRSMEELEQHLESANTPGNELALVRMCAYVRDAQSTPRDARSPVQSAALLKWKTPSWVPAESRPPTKSGNPNAPAGVNTPRLTDPPEEWAQMDVEISKGGRSAPWDSSRKGWNLPVLDKRTTVGHGACTPWSRSNM